MHNEKGYTGRLRREAWAVATSRSRTTYSQTDAKALIEKLGGDWYGDSGNASCPVCQLEARLDQRALSVRQDASRLLVYCHKSNCAFDDILSVAKFALRQSPNNGVPPIRKAALESAQNTSNGGRAK